MKDSAVLRHILRVRHFTCLALAVASLCVLGVSSAHGFTAINQYSMDLSTSQAGGHPDVTIRLDADTRSTQNGSFVTPPPGTCNCQDLETIDIHFPTGFIGDPTALPQCTLAEFSTAKCPVNTQVGEVEFPTLFDFRVPFYNMQPRPNEPGLTAFQVPVVNGVSFTVFHGRTGSDYGLDATTSGIFHLLPVNQINIRIWGVPALPSHDLFRWPQQQGFCAQNPPPNPCFQPTSSNSPPVPYLENPTSCGTPLSAALDIRYYDFTTVHADTPLPGTVGCDQLTFNPSLTALPTTSQADSASGVDVDVKVPQTLEASVPSASEIRATTVTLPPGFSINPNAADGKAACSDSDAGFGTENAAQCPEAAKVGTDQLTSTALPGPIDGAIYLGQPLPGNRYRVFLTADGFATHVKLAGSVHPDSQTGQLVFTFDNLPQSPFSDFNLHIFGSERGLLATPTQCGTYPVNTDFTPWDTVLKSQHSLSSFTIDSGPNGQPCPAASRPFNPQMVAGTQDNTAGVHTPFTLQLSRQDGDQNLTSLSITAPPGFSATLKGIPYCPQADLNLLADPSYTGLDEQGLSACPPASQIGTTTTGVGAGTHPLYTPGKVYLAGPYKGAPLSLEAVIPAVSGPYDLGNVAVRTALNVDPQTAQVTAVTDPLPQILDGIPLRLRSILINLDRPNFTLNPTNCDPFAVNLSAFGDQGAQANLSTHFQVANCTDLGFSPKLALRLAGGTKRNGHPAIHASLDYTQGQANIKSVGVTLPHTEQTDTTHLGTACTTPQFDAGQCPDNSILGTATASTPLLDQPLSGKVYLVSAGNPLPDIVLALRGQIDVNLHGKVDTAANGGLRTTFATVPDVPVSSFRLDLVGGKKGLVVNNTDICKHLAPAVAKIAAQNGASANQNIALGTSCGKARHKRHPNRVRAVR